MSTELVEGAIATIRLGRLVRDDAITENARDRFFRRYPITMEMSDEIVRPRGRRWQPIESTSGAVVGWCRVPKIGPFARDLLSCPYWCLSMWTGATIALLLRAGPVGRLIVRTLVLSQLNAMFSDMAVPLPPRRK